jgi:hypothetical protein
MVVIYMSRAMCPIGPTISIAISVRLIVVCDHLPRILHIASKFAARLPKEWVPLHTRELLTLVLHRGWGQWAAILTDHKFAATATAQGDDDGVAMGVRLSTLIHPRQLECVVKYISSSYLEHMVADYDIATSPRPLYFLGYRLAYGVMPKSCADVIAQAGCVQEQGRRESGAVVDGQDDEGLYDRYVDRR